LASCFSFIQLYLSKKSCIYPASTKARILANIKLLLMQELFHESCIYLSSIVSSIQLLLKQEFYHQCTVLFNCIVLIYPASTVPLKQYFSAIQVLFNQDSFRLSSHHLNKSSFIYTQNYRPLHRIVTRIFLHVKHAFEKS